MASFLSLQHFVVMRSGDFCVCMWGISLVTNNGDSLLKTDQILYVTTVLYCISQNSLNMVGRAMISDAECISLCQLFDVWHYNQLPQMQSVFCPACHMHIHLYYYHFKTPTLIFLKVVPHLWHIWWEYISPIAKTG